MLLPPIPLLCIGGYLLCMIIAFLLMTVRARAWSRESRAEEAEELKRQLEKLP